MSNFPQDVYARNLLSHRGYPLWTPEPNIELPESYQREGLKIGDVGVVVPENGSFDVFFNTTLPREHPLHAPDGVPDNFTQVKLRREDYRIVPDADSAGRVISSSSVECTVGCVDPFELDGKSCSLTDHQFSLFRNEGAMLILPEGAEHHRLAKNLMLLDVVIRNAVNWYRFAREQLYRDISNDALYLVTGFHKAQSWSLASFRNTGASSARCKLVQSTNGGPILANHCTWETPRPLEWRIGPRHSNGIPNQSVFITGFKIAVNEELLHLKRVTVKADHSKRTLASTLVGFGASLANIVVGGTLGGAHTPETATGTQDGENGQLTTDKDEHAYEPHEHVTVERLPHASQPFHPSDIINRYLLTKEPSAMFAVTHDDQWIALLEKGILRPEELTQGRLEEVVSQEYHIVTRDGAVYLQNIEPEASGSIASGQSPSALFAANSVTSSQTKSDVDMDDDNNDNHEEEEQVKQDDRPLTTTANASSEEYKTTDGEDSDRTIEEMDIEDSACEAEETVPSRSYSNFNRTEARLASQLVKPGPVIFPPSHSYRLSRSSANIPGLYQHPRHAPPLQWSIGAYAPPRLSATKSAAQQNAINGSKLPSSSAVEHWHESQKNVDRPEDQEIGDDSSNENELKSHRSLECGTSPHLIHPDAMEVGPSTTTSIPPGAPYIQPPSFIGFDSEPLADSDSTGSALPDVDPRIVEALKGKDRVYILKLGEQMESLINDRRPHIDLRPKTSYQQLLIHKSSAYYRLARKTDATTKVVRVLLTPDSRIPSRRFAELAPAQSPAQLTSKILLQSPTDRQISKPHSRTGSVAGEDSDLSDQEPPGATSLGWHSNATWRRKNLETLSSPRLITHSTRQARAYHHASDLPAEFWRALSQNEAASNVILPFAKKALNFPREDDNGDQLWIVLYDGTNDVEFVLSCTKGPLGNYPIFIVTSKSSSQIAQEEKHGKKLADSLLPLVLCLLNEVPPQRVFSVFSIAKVAWTFAEIFEVNTRHEHGIEALEQPYYDATLTFCTSETLNEPPDSMASFPASGSDDIVVDRRRADMSHLKGITAMCKAFSETSPPFVLDDLGAELEARLLITNQQACVHVVHKDGQEPEIACLVATTRESENVTAITKVFTAEHWKGRGFAARLLHCVCQCILQKKKRVVLYVDNSEASVSIRKVYHKIGFQGLDVSGQQVKDVERWMEIGFVGTNLGHW